MKYEKIAEYSNTKFRRITGVTRGAFQKKMVEILLGAYVEKHRRRGRTPKLSIEDLLLATLEYLREYRTYAMRTSLRNSCKFVPCKDRKAVCADLKKIYGAVNLDDAECAKEEFREKWDRTYPNILRSWDKNWVELTFFFEYPNEIRKIIYTTNAVEGYHRMVRKFTKTKAISQTDDSIRKAIYMSTKEISKKWTTPVRDWGLAYAQFLIFFEVRFAA